MAKYSIVEPKVDIIDYCPKVVDKDGKVILTPDDIISLSSQRVRNNLDMYQNLKKMEQENTDIRKKLRGTTIGSTGRGHASATTSIDVAIDFRGTCSKLVDSMFTTAKFGTSLMPSGRATGINRDQIVIPEAISRASEKVQEVYVKASEYNIDLYEKLLSRGIKQDAAGKIVQYGIYGGGFTVMPLETIIGFALDYELNPEAIPEEGKQILQQIEYSMKRIGASQTYAARKNAARATYPNPNIFKFSENHISDLLQEYPEIFMNPKIIHLKNLESKSRDNALDMIYQRQTEILSTPQGVIENWRKLMVDRKDLINEYNLTVEVHLASVIPWRVWGELKRHRTVPQNAESIYKAINRAKDALYAHDIAYLEHPEEYVQELEKVISIPPSIKADKELLKDWVKAYWQSFLAYDFLTTNGIKESDAVQVIPRGIKLGVEKVPDLFNLTNGYYPVRLCGTAEEEMRRNTLYESNLIKKALNNPSINQHIVPKCAYVGFCLEPWTKYCHAIEPHIKFGYTEETHVFFEKARKLAIEATESDIYSHTEI
jgi:thymidylate synthase ThyX